MLRICLCLIMLGTTLGTTVVHADDWPQWMGLKRDNVWRETGVVDTLPKDPKIVWRAPVAGGYSGPAVAAGKVYVTDYETKDEVKVGNFERKASTGTERVLCLDEKTGKEIWSVPRPETYTISYLVLEVRQSLITAKSMLNWLKDNFTASTRTRAKKSGKRI